VLLVRHASAGDRGDWEGDDRTRPLDEKGKLQAERLVGLLEPYGVERILSSPAARCVATVEPLARARGLAIEAREELAEERQSSAGAELVRSLRGTYALVCGHGGLEHATLAEARRWKKGAVLVLDDDLRVVETLRP
jgi:8-oxo-dGTP diphosphatase